MENIGHIKAGLAKPDRGNKNTGYFIRAFHWGAVLGEYTAVICIAVLSFTLFPEVLPPIKNEYALPEVLSTEASLPRNMLLKNPMSSSNQKGTHTICKRP